MTLNNATYDKFKAIALIYLPALAALYVGLAQIWNLPHPAEVSATIAAIDTFLGIGVHVSSKNYTPPKPAADGHLVVDDSDPEKTTARLEFVAAPQDLVKKENVVLKVVHPNLNSPPIPGPHGG